MGLDTTHNCWHGPYGAFARFRIRIAHAVGETVTDDERAELELWYRDDFARGIGADGVWDENEPRDPVYVILCHADNEGTIYHRHTRPLADRLDGIRLNLVNEPSANYFASELLTFANGLRRAHDAVEDVHFQ